MPSRTDPTAPRVGDRVRRRATRSIVREARADDIDRLVEVELETFRDVYESRPVNPQTIRQMITTRLETAGDLMVVGEVDGVIEGVAAAQRTNKEVESITSWESSTNFGTLRGTHEPGGKYLYVVNLAVTGRGSAAALGDRLIARLVAIGVAGQVQEAHLLSRMPQFRKWLAEHRIPFGSLSITQQDQIAADYVAATRVVDGREQLYDGLLQRYADIGGRFRRILRNGYEDPPSLNYSVVCTVANPLPLPWRRSRILSRVVAAVFVYASNHPWLLRVLP